MSQKTDSNSYHPVSKIIHWVTALIVLALLSVGYIMTDMDFSPFKLNIYMMHKSFGLLVLALVIVRIVWRIIVPPPKSLDSHACWEKFLAKIVHFLLYFGLITMPLSGWLMSSAGEFPVNFFGIFEMPSLSSKDASLFKLTKEIHELGAVSLLVAIGLHFLGAAKHHFIDSDETVKRMGGNTILVLLGALLLLSPTVLFVKDFMGHTGDETTLENDEPSANSGISDAFTQNDENEWIINSDSSFIKFEFSQYGQPVQGEFESFKGRIIFDPSDLGASQANILIYTSSIATGSEDRDSQAQSESWFAVEEFPVAIFQTESFTHLEGEQYNARGNLTIRGTSFPVVLPFSLKIEEHDDGSSNAYMNAEISLMRLDFGVGQGEWESTEAIDNEVKVAIFIEASQGGNDSVIDSTTP